MIIYLLCVSLGIPSCISLTSFLTFPSGKMTDIFVKEHKKLILEAHSVRRVAGQNAAKSDLPGLKTWLLKKRKVVPNKEIPNVSESQPPILSPLKNFRLGSPKKMKTLMSDEVCRADWEISSLTCKNGGSHQTRSSNEFKF